MEKEYQCITESLLFYIPTWIIQLKSIHCRMPEAWTNPSYPYRLMFAIKLKEFEKK